MTGAFPPPNDGNLRDGGDHTLAQSLRNGRLSQRSRLSRESDEQSQERVRQLVAEALGGDRPRAGVVMWLGMGSGVECPRSCAEPLPKGFMFLGAVSPVAAGEAEPDPVRWDGSILTGPLLRSRWSAPPVWWEVPGLGSMLGISLADMDRDGGLELRLLEGPGAAWALSEVLRGASSRETVALSYLPFVLEGYDEQRRRQWRVVVWEARVTPSFQYVGFNPDRLSHTVGVAGWRPRREDGAAVTLMTAAPVGGSDAVSAAAAASGSPLGLAGTRRRCAAGREAVLRFFRAAEGVRFGENTSLWSLLEAIATIARRAADRIEVSASRASERERDLGAVTRMTLMMSANRWTGVDPGNLGVLAVAAVEGGDGVPVVEYPPVPGAVEEPPGDGYAVAGSPSLVDHARREMQLAGMFEDDPAFAQALLSAVGAFAAYGHSGGSASVAVPTLELLLRQEALTPLTSDPSEWIDRSWLSPGEPLWQNVRDTRAMSTDGGKTWLYVSPRHRGERYRDGGLLGTLVVCGQCSGDGLLHSPDPGELDRAPATAPTPEPAPSPTRPRGDRVVAVVVEHPPVHHGPVDARKHRVGEYPTMINSRCDVAGKYYPGSSPVPAPAAGGEPAGGARGGADPAMNLPSDEEPFAAGDLLEMAWGLIAAAGHGDWGTQSTDWQRAARRWREGYFRVLGVGVAAGPGACPDDGDIETVVGPGPLRVVPVELGEHVPEGEVHFRDGVTGRLAGVLRNTGAGWVMEYRPSGDGGDLVDVAGEGSASVSVDSAGGGSADVGGRRRR